MGKCIFEDICDKSWCRLYSFECIDDLDKYETHITNKIE